MGRLEGKTALITGAASGIGNASARLMAQAGAKVIVADIDLEAARRLVEEIKARGGEARALRLDVLDEESIREVVRKSCEIYGMLNVLHNNAGGTDVTRDNTVVDSDWEYWDTAMAWNLKSTVL